MEEFYNLVIQYATFPVAIICFGIGYVIKHYIPKINNKYIPLILACFGLMFNLIFNNFVVNFDVIVSGIGSGLIATGSFELVRNLADKNKNKKE